MTEDERWMARCIALARKAEGRTAPNPLVGCVIVKDGQMIAEGWHERAGEPHAEVIALRRAKGRAKGATLYVNLEPCDHQGRTPPCAPAVIESGIARVVIGMMDPLPEHTGGARRIKRAGIEVVKGVLEAECEALNRVWLRSLAGRPYVLLKAGVSLDGKIATHKGDTRWITGEASRAEAHYLRNVLDAVVVGVNTVLIDNPRLTARGVPGYRDPIRIVLDTHGRTPPDAYVLPLRSNRKDARVVIATSEAAPTAKLAVLEKRGAEIWVLPTTRKRIDLFELLRRLHKEHVMGLLVEGGAEVHAAFIRDDLADEIRLFVAPMIIGGGISDTAGPTWTAGKGVALLGNARRYQFDEPPRLQGDDVVLTARRKPTS